LNFRSGVVQEMGFDRVIYDKHMPTLMNNSMSILICIRGGIEFIASCLPDDLHELRESCRKVGTNYCSAEASSNKKKLNDEIPKTGIVWRTQGR